MSRAPFGTLFAGLLALGLVAVFVLAPLVARLAAGLERVLAVTS